MILDELPDDLGERVVALRALVAHHNERYHAEDAPEIPDADFDSLVAELRRLEADHPELADAQSPAQSVGAAPSSLFSPVSTAWRCRSPMSTGSWPRPPRAATA